MNLFRIAVLLLLCFTVTACGGTAPQEAVVASTPTLAATPEPAPTSVEGDAATAAPAEAAEAPEAASEVAETDWLTVEGKTEDNLTFLGNPDAPVILIDHSDFL